MHINKRRPFDKDIKGYKESDKDYVLNNIEACVILLDLELKKNKMCRRAGITNKERP